MGPHPKRRENEFYFCSSLFDFVLERSSQSAQSDYEGTYTRGIFFFMISCEIERESSLRFRVLRCVATDDDGSGGGGAGRRM